MKAAFFTQPRVIEIREVENPVTPPDGLKIDVKACAVCGSDLRRWREGPQPGADIIPGHEIAGIVTDMLIYSRKGRPAYEMVDPGALVRGVVELMAGKARLSGVTHSVYFPVLA